MVMGRVVMGLLECWLCCSLMMVVDVFISFVRVLILLVVDRMFSFGCLILVCYVVIWRFGGMGRLYCL